MDWTFEAILANTFGTILALTFQAVTAQVPGKIGQYFPNQIGNISMSNWLRFLFQIGPDFYSRFAGFLGQIGKISKPDCPAFLGYIGPDIQARMALIFQAVLAQNSRPTFPGQTGLNFQAIFLGQIGLAQMSMPDFQIFRPNWPNISRFLCNSRPEWQECLGQIGSDIEARL